MQIKTNRLFLFFTFLVYSFSTKGQYTKINDNISIKFVGKHIPDPKLMTVSNNKSILWFERIILNNEEHLFSLSKFINKQKAPINILFDKYVRSLALPKTTIFEAGTYKKDGLTFYYKITQTEFEDKIKRTNTLFYLMPNNYSNILYEFKIISNNYNKIVVMNYLENIIKTAMIKE